MSKIKLLLLTDSARNHTGLGENCRLVFKELLNRFPDKYEIHQLGWFNFSGVEEIPWPIYSTNLVPQPNGQQAFDHEDRYGQKTFEGVLLKVKPDIVWSSGDIWCFDHLVNSPNRNSFRLALYYTIDGAPYYGTWIKPGHSSEWGSKLTRTDELIVWSEFGKEVLKESCPELKNTNIKVIYHPADLNRFKSLSPSQKTAERSRLYNGTVPNNAFILGFIGRNQFRKQNYKLWEVFHYTRHGDYIECEACNRITVKEYNWNDFTVRTTGKYMYDDTYDYSVCWHCKSPKIKAGKPLDDIYLWQHMPKSDPAYNFPLHLKSWKIEDRVIHSGVDHMSRGMSPQQLADIMATWNGFIYLSGGEGFGIPAFEAQVSGLPIIYANYSSHADFAKHGGLPVRCDFIPEFAFGINRSIANTNHAVERILWAYRNRDEFDKLGQNGRNFAMTKNVTAVANDWDSLFTDMMKKPSSLNGSKNVYATVV